MKTKLLATVAALTLFAFAGPSYADEAAAQKWINDEFQPSDPLQRGSAEGNAMVH